MRTSFVHSLRVMAVSSSDYSLHVRAIIENSPLKEENTTLVLFHDSSPVCFTP